ncbi:MAG: sensor histidine kinase [Candidatus Nanopelagicaceae bacterium]
MALMLQIDELLKSKSNLTSEEIAHVKRVASDWQLIADLSFADLAIWVKSKSGKELAVAQVRAATAATVFPQDFVGDEVSELFNGPGVDYFPIRLNKQVIATIARHRNSEVTRSSGRLEGEYQAIAQLLLDMVGESTFPFATPISSLNPSPRVGDGFIHLDKNGSVLYASPNGRSAFSRLGWESELEGVALATVVSEISKQPISEHQESINNLDVTQIELESRGGSIELTLLPLLNSGVRLGSVVLLHNVTEIRRRERELLLKDATIKEIHHRVKNNLQTVSALLRLQSRRVEDLKARGALDEAVRRISSIALVHETLSASGKDEVDFDSVVDSLITHAVDLAPRATNHVTDISVKRLGALGSVDPKVATPLSLVITELVANAIEHGLTTKGSKVDVVFSRTGNSCVVKIEDDGVGLPAGFSLKDSSNLGLQIVRTLTESELKGSLEISGSEKGTTAQLRFEIR